MPSLVECVVSELESGDSDMPEDPIELMAQFDLDPDAISNVEGSWEPVEVGDRTAPKIEGVVADIFQTEGPSVYEADGYMIVRGREDVHHVFFAYERTV